MTHSWFISTKYRRNSTLALITCALAFVVILLGAYTRLTNAGLSCPDWPNCFGYLTAPHTAAQIQDAAQKFPATAVDVKKAWTEMTHRYFAGTEGILILVLAFSFLFTRKTRGSKATIIAIALIALLCVQVMLGMLTVTEKLKPVIVLSHLLTGISILSVLWWAYLEIQPLRRPRMLLAGISKCNSGLRSKTQNEFGRSPTKAFGDDGVVGFFGMTRLQWLHAGLWLALIIVLLQITLGGWVSTHYAGLACVDFPYCNGTLLPTLQMNNLNNDLITIHMLHRFGAFITASYLILLAGFLFTNAAFKTFARFIFVLVALQITLGIYNIIWLRPVWIALMHQAVAIILFLTIITALVKTFYLSEQPS